MRKILPVFLVALLQWVMPAVAFAEGDDAARIVAVMKAQFDRPDAALTVDPVTVVGSYAVAGWTQGGKGGRALLQRDKGAWVIAVCAGDGLARVDVLQTTGMNGDQARTLSRAVAAAEAKVSKDRLKLFSTFEGMVHVKAGHEHGGHDMHGTHSAASKP